jgi:hypothetical protein
MKFRETQTDGTGSGQCPLAGFGIEGVAPSGSSTGELISEMGLTELFCQDVKWTELAQDSVHWRPLVLKVLHLQVLVQKLSFVS